MSDAETIAELRERVARMEVQIEAMAKTLTEIAAVVTSARAGTKFVVTLFGMAASVGAGVAYFWQHFKFTP